MRILSVAWLISGAMAAVMGALPLFFSYPYCQDCAHSGPSNSWELLLMIAYEGQGWYLGIGFVLLLLSIRSMIRQRRFSQ